MKKRKKKQPTKRKTYNKKIQAKVLKAREKGLTWKAIAERLEIPSGSVHSIAHRSY